MIVMDPTLFDVIVKKLTAAYNPYQTLESLAAEYSWIPFDTLLSIYTQMYQSHTRKCAHIHKRQENIDKYIERYDHGERLLDIASSIDLAPCLLARIVIHQKLNTQGKEATQYLRNTNEISDGRLKEEVQCCVDADRHYSPFSDKIRSSIGLEYEYVLFESLFIANIPFDSEDDLRKEGRPKTPDVRLRSPIGVRGHIVKWIDSKAMFGDEYNHAKLQSQIRGYVHRFGPGMVIYWFGYVANLDQSSDILVSHCFPRHNEIDRVV